MGNQSKPSWIVRIGGGFLSACFSVAIYAYLTQTPRPPSETKPGIPDSSALEVNARGVVSEFLIAPSTAKFPATEILEREGKFVLARVKVDAQNAFGAMLRTTYYVVFQNDTPEPGRVTWLKKWAVQELDDRTSPDTVVALLKATNNWPKPVAAAPR